MAMECKVCREDYTAASRPPLCLPCGHSFCRQCLGVLEARGGLKCPTCHTPHSDCPIAQLPINLDLLSEICGSSSTGTLERRTLRDTSDERRGHDRPTSTSANIKNSTSSEPSDTSTGSSDRSTSSDPARDHGPFDATPGRREPASKDRKYGYASNDRSARPTSKDRRHDQTSDDPNKFLTDGATLRPGQDAVGCHEAPESAITLPPLLPLAARGDVKELRAELDGGSDVNLRSPIDGRTALHLACRGGHVACIVELLRYGATVNARDSEGRRALHFAAMGGHFHILPLLMRKGAMMETQDSQGMRAVHFAAGGGHLQTLKALDERGCLLSAVCGSDQSTALHLAAENGHLEVVEWLVEQGLSVSAKDLRHRTAERRAAEAKQEHVSSYLRKLNESDRPHRGFTGAAQGFIRFRDAQVKPKPRVKAKPQVRDEVKPKPRVKAKPQVRDEVNPKPRVKPKPHVRGEVKPQVRDEVKPPREVKPPASGEVKPPVREDIKPKPSEVKPQARGEVKPPRDEVKPLVRENIKPKPGEVKPQARDEVKPPCEVKPPREVKPPARDEVKPPCEVKPHARGKAKPPVRENIKPKPGEGKPPARGEVKPPRDKSEQKSRGASISDVDVRLLEAASDGDLFSVREALSDGANVNVMSTRPLPSETGLGAIHLAAWSGYGEVVRQLLHAGADPHIHAHGLSAVHWASVGGHVGVLRVLGESLTDRASGEGGPGGAGGPRRSPGSDGPISGPGGPMGRPGVEGGASGSVPLERTPVEGLGGLTGGGWNALHLAAHHGNLEAVRWLVEEGGLDPSTPTPPPTSTPLSLAKAAHHTHIVTYLLSLQ